MTQRVIEALIARGYERVPIADLAEELGLSLDEVVPAIQAAVDADAIEVARAEPWEFGGRGRDLPAIYVLFGRNEIGAQVARAVRTTPIDPGKWETRYFPTRAALDRFERERGGAGR